MVNDNDWMIRGMEWMGVKWGLVGLGVRDWEPPGVSDIALVS